MKNDEEEQRGRYCPICEEWIQNPSSSQQKDEAPGTPNETRPYLAPADYRMDG